MSTYTIGQVADRSGFSASALRYYEGVGLVAPATRSAAGYRLYDDHTLDRLAFVARAKQLGCSLPEITDLVAIWDGDGCEPVQRRFHDLVTAKTVAAKRQIRELTAFTAQLQAAATQLAGSATDGPCGAECACLTGTPPAAEPVSVTLTAKPDVPIACTLDAGAMPARLTEWRAVLDRARARISGADGSLRVEFADDLALSELAALVAAEQQCCAFFSFAITVDHRGVALEVRAPDGADDIVASMFGQPG